MPRFTPIQKEKIRTLITHAQKDIQQGKSGTYRKLHLVEVNKKAVTQAEAAIKLLEELIF